MTARASEDEPLADALTRLGYRELFLRADSDDTIDRIWSRPGASSALRALALSPTSAALPQFLAAEVLFARDHDFPEDGDRGRVAEVYARALSDNLTEIANPWGMPGDLNVPVVTHVVSLGRAAVAPFASLLDDGREVRYSGSKEATYGNSFRYRVKDIAASLIAAMLGLSDPVSQDRAVRDAAIEVLRRRVPPQPDGTSR